MKRNSLIFIIIILISSIVSPSYALRCGNQLVLEGDSKFDLKKKCGDPDFIDSYQENVPIYNQAGYQIGTATKTVDKWYYQKLPNEFKYEIIFSEGNIKEINASR